MNFQSLSKRFDPIPVAGSMKSQTVPDMSFTPREIIQKFSRGERVPLGFNGLYDSEDDSDHLGDYDSSIFEDDPTRDRDFDKFDYVEEVTALKERQRIAKERKKADERAKQRSNGKDVTTSQRKASAEESSESAAMMRETISGEVVTPSSGQRGASE